MGTGSSRQDKAAMLWFDSCGRANKINNTTTPVSFLGQQKYGQVFRFDFFQVGSNKILIF